MKRTIAFVWVCLFATSAYAGTITVAVASSLQEAMAKIASQYKAAGGDDVELVVGSSGQLAMQIRNGAPVDLFISAANKQVDDLARTGIVDETTRRVLAGNSLVLIVPSPSKGAPDSLRALADSSVTRIALGEPESVPAGLYAEQALKQAGVMDAVKDKLVFGSNVRQVMDYVKRGEVSAGLVYATDAKLSGGRVRTTCVIDDLSHDPIVYPAVIVTTSKQRLAAARFLDYLVSTEGQAALKEFGFTPGFTPTTQPSR